MAAANLTDKTRLKRRPYKRVVHTREMGTQCGKWLQLKVAIEKDEAFRAQVLQEVENEIAQGQEQQELSPEDERTREETGKALCTHHIVDLALLNEPLNSCKWKL